MKATVTPCKRSTQYSLRAAFDRFLRFTEPASTLVTPLRTLVALGVTVLVPAMIMIATSSSAAPNKRLATEVQLARKSVVRIEAATQSWDLKAPWNAGSIQNGVGAGFVIAGQRILTNAHVVSDARLITIKKDGDSIKYPAEVAQIAHDSDLAILKVHDESFFEDTEALEFGGVPELQSTVSAYGYPIGGERLSVTRGVVSRVDFRLYSHSGFDMHLAIQVDAAINPGNSGGPVMQDGRVVGVAFQGYRGTVAQNVGYAIPTTVVQRVLDDVEDGTYDHMADLFVSAYPLIHHDTRSYLELTDEVGGVVIATTYPGGSADGVLQRGDVITAIDGLPIQRNGYVAIDGERQTWQEIVERKLVGETVKLDIIREQTTQTVEIPLKRAPADTGRVLTRQYDRAPSYIVHGGLVFQPISVEFLHAYGNDNLRIRYLVANAMTESEWQERSEIVVVSRVLPDSVNAEVDESTEMQIVDSINGTKVTDMVQLAGLLDETETYTVIEFMGFGLPVVLRRDEIEASEDRIASRYGIPASRRLPKGRTPSPETDEEPQTPTTPTKSEPSSEPPSETAS